MKSLNLGATEVFLEQSSSKTFARLPRKMVLGQNVPNPFNPTTTIHFALPPEVSREGGRRVRLEVYNLRGALVRTLLDDLLPQGYHSVIWDGNNRLGRALPSGVYFYRLRAGNQVLTRKMILLK